MQIRERLLSGLSENVPCAGLTVLTLVFGYPALLRRTHFGFCEARAQMRKATSCLLSRSISTQALPFSVRFGTSAQQALATGQPGTARLQVARQALVSFTEEHWFRKHSLTQAVPSGASTGIYEALEWGPSGHRTVS